MTARVSAERPAESVMLDRLERHVLGDRSQGEEAVFVRQAEYKGRRIDGLAVQMWKSRGHTIDAYEVKTSRPDLVRELRNSAKADVWFGVAHRFWLVVHTAKLVEGLDIPEPWGVLVASGKQVRVLHKPERREHTTVDLEAFAPIVRRIGQLAGNEYSRGVEAGRKYARDAFKSEVDLLKANSVGGYEERAAFDLGKGIHAAWKAVAWKAGSEYEAFRALSDALVDPERLRALVDPARRMHLMKNFAESSQHARDHAERTLKRVQDQLAGLDDDSF